MQMSPDWQEFDSHKTSEWNPAEYPDTAARRGCGRIDKKTGHRRPV